MEASSELILQKIKILNQSVSVYTTDKSILQNWLSKSSWYLSKNKLPVLQTLFILQRNTRGNFGRKWRRKLVLPQHSWHIPVPASISECYRRLQQNVFCNQDAPVLRLDDTVNRYIVQREVKFFSKKISSLDDSLRDFLKTFDRTSKCLHIPLPKPKIEIWSTKSKDNLFAPFYECIIEHPNKQIRFSFWFGNNSFCVFSVKKFELHGDQFVLAEGVNVNHREIYNLYRNPYYAAIQCEIFESN